MFDLTTTLIRTGKQILPGWLPSTVPRIRFPEVVQLVSADLVVPNLEARSLKFDFESLQGLSQTLAPYSPLANLARITANEIMNAFSAEDPNSLKVCRKLAEKVLGREWENKLVKARGKEGKDEDGRLWAIGHCHIDTACELCM